MGTIKNYLITAIGSLLKSAIIIGIAWFLYANGYFSLTTSSVFTAAVVVESVATMAVAISEYREFVRMKRMFYDNVLTISLTREEDNNNKED